MANVVFRLTKRLNRIEFEIADGASRERLYVLRRGVYRIFAELKFYGFAVDSPLSALYLRSTYVLVRINVLLGTYCRHNS